MKTGIKTRLLSIILSVGILFTSLPFTISTNAADFAGGSGTKEDPYKIATAKQLMAFNAIVNSGKTGTCAILIADINIKGEDWKPLGVYSDVSGFHEGTFTGTFDGNGHIIDGLTVTTNTPVESGFFGRAQGATIKNLTIVNASVTNTAYTRAGILGGELHVSTVENCFTHGTVTVTADSELSHTNGEQAGGIAGEAVGTVLKNCGTSMSVLAYASSYQNCFYVSKNDNDGMTGSTNIPDIEMLATGEAAYFMNNTLGTTVWYQNLDATTSPDIAPVASNAGGRGAVYKVRYRACPSSLSNTSGIIYSNSDKDQWNETHTYINGICKYCNSHITTAELAEAKRMAKDELDAYANSNSYRPAEATLVANCVNSAKTVIDNADTYEEIDSALADGKTEIDSIKTNDDYLREEHEPYMVKRRADLQNYVDRSLYRDAQLPLVDQAIADGIAAINLGTSNTMIDAAFEAAKAAIDTIPTHFYLLKEEAVAQLKSYKDSGLYRQSDFQPAFNNGKDLIMSCLTEEDIPDALAEAKTYIDALKTDEELSAEENLTEPNMVSSNKSFETGSFAGWSVASGAPEVLKASSVELEDGSSLIAAHGDYVAKLNASSLFYRSIGPVVAGTSYKITCYVYEDDSIADLQGRQPTIYLSSHAYDPQPFVGTARQYSPIYINTSREENNWVKYELVFPALPYLDDGTTPALFLCMRSWDGGTWYFDNFKVEAVEAVYSSKTVDAVSTGRAMIPLDSSKLTVGKNYSLMLGTTNITDFVASPTTESTIKANLYTKENGQWVDSGLGTVVKASELFSYAGSNTTSSIHLMSHSKFYLPESADGEYALGLEYVSGDVGLDLTYITLANIHIPDASPELFLYEGFDYAVTNGADSGDRVQSVGQQSGYWSNGWGFADDCAAILETSLAYDDADFNMLQTSGRSMRHGWPWGSNAYRTFALKEAYNHLDIATENGEIGMPGSTVYASFLYNNENASPRIAFTKGGGTYDFGNADRYLPMNNPAIHIQIATDENGDRVFALVDSNEQQLGQPILSGVNFENGKTYFIVLKMEFGATNKFSLYVNPQLETEPKKADVVFTNTLSYKLDSILVDGQNTFNNMFDEFRLATTYAAATPSAGTNYVAIGKIEAIEEINSHLNVAEYRDAEKETIANTINAWTIAINACTSMAELSTAKADAIAALDAIKTDAEITADEIAAQQLAEAKLRAKEELDTYKDAALYRDAQKLELADAIVAGKVAIDSCTVLDEVVVVLANAKAAMDAIKTDTQITEELAQAKTEAISELEAFRSAADYRPAEKELFEEALAAAKVAINACEDINGVAVVLENAKATIGEIKTDAEYDLEEAVPTPLPTGDSTDAGSATVVPTFAPDETPSATPDVAPIPSANPSVNPISAVKKITFAKKTIRIKVGKKATLKVKLLPAKGLLSKAAKNVKWAINKKGKRIVKFVKKPAKLRGKVRVKIKALRRGKSQVTCKAPNGKKAVCKIIVR